MIDSKTAIKSDSNLQRLKCNQHFGAFVSHMTGGAQTSTVKHSLTMNVGKHGTRYRHSIRHEISHQLLIA